jgi:hypothetical protein
MIPALLLALAADKDLFEEAFNTQGTKHTHIIEPP